jgi:hypothetical protein
MSIAIGNGRLSITDWSEETAMPMPFDLTRELDSLANPVLGVATFPAFTST